MQPENNTRRPAPRTILLARHRDICRRVYWALDHQKDDDWKVHLTPAKEKAVRAKITELVNTAGCERGHNDSKTLELALKTVKSLGTEEEVAAAYKVADRIGEWVNPVWEEGRDRRIQAIREKIATAAEPTPQREYDAKLTINDDHGDLGFVRGDIVGLTETEDLAPWDICGVDEKGEEFMYLGRVVVCSPQSLTYRCDGEEYTTPRSQIETLYRVDPEPVGREDGLTDDERKRLKELRDQLGAVESDTDWENTLSGVRYKIEKLIFDITNPPGGDPDDWSAWEEKEAAR
jgi:hypothetical protein